MFAWFDGKNQTIDDYAALSDTTLTEFAQPPFFSPDSTAAREDPSPLLL